MSLCSILYYLLCTLKINYIVVLVMFKNVVLLSSRPFFVIVSGFLVTVGANSCWLRWSTNVVLMVYKFEHLSG